MPEIMLKIPAQVNPSQIETLRAELRPYADVQQPPAQSFDFASTALVVASTVAFSANFLQIADILAGWLKRAPKGNQAEIRLSDGRTLKMEANADPDEFVEQLRAALKGL
ncbi:MAG: hypothetical protein ACOYZ8_14320 [Chloroflexota bacterium]